MSSPAGRLHGKVAIITGGASGIGAATSARLVSEGAQVALFDRAAGQTGQGCTSYRVDVTDQASIDDAVAAVVSDWGHIDILVNSAGIGAAGGIAANSDSEWQQVLDVNLMGTVRTIRAALPHLVAAAPANVVNVASAVADIGFPDRAAYSASKGAVVALTRALAADHLREGVRFNAVSPGTTDSPWVQRLLSQAQDPDARRAALEARQPHGRLVSVAEVAEAILYLASPQAGSANGVTLAVDGGISTLYVQ
ncbi:MAG: SDR family NAD(P)-dependent oxidoreductase [Beutenbergiaceae bacterium]